MACVLLVAALSATPALAGRYDDLYRAQAVVTGTGETNRAPGLAQSLEDVVVKVSGDQRLIGDPRVAAMGREADIFVRKLTYRDRLEGIPIHDEQGSYDRPHDLIVDFNRLRINTALRSLGRKPWTERRPRIAVFLAVQRDANEFVVVADGERDRDMRESLAAAAERVGLPIVLPTDADLTGTPETSTKVATLLPTPVPEASEPLKTFRDSEVTLTGALTWSDEAHGWIVDWRMVPDGVFYAWRVEGVGFDDAFRNGLRGAAQVLSGNGQPDSDSLAK